LQTMNREIAAAQFKVGLEREIFDLASTRVGLESQLLTAQNQQTRLDIERISALATLVRALQSGDVSALTPLLNSLPGVAGVSLDFIDQLIAGAYQSRSSMGFGSFKGQNL
jgi:hypothetical protein